MTMHAISDNVIYSQGNVQTCITYFYDSFLVRRWILIATQVRKSPGHIAKEIHLQKLSKETKDCYPTSCQPSFSCNISCVKLFDYKLFSLAVFFFRWKGRGYGGYMNQPKVVRKVDLLRSIINSFFSLLYSSCSQKINVT